MPHEKFDTRELSKWGALLGTTVASLALSCVIAAPTSADVAPEPPTGSKLPPALDQLPTDDARIVLAAFAKCNVQRDPGLAREFILSSRNYSLDEKYRGVTRPECLGQAVEGRPVGTAQLQLTTNILRYITAEALVSRDLKRFNPDLVRTAAPLPELTIDPGKMRLAKGGATATPAQTAENFAAAKTEVAVVKYGECVVRADPHGSQRLLATKINSTEEGAALTALLPAFSACLETGHQFGANRLNLRGIVALNYYRLAFAPQAASAAKP